MHSIDLAVQSYISLHRTQLLTEFMYLVTELFNVSTFIFIAAAFFVLMYLVRGKKYALLFSTTLIIGGLLSIILKSLFNVSRPEGGVITVFSKSFPSGHALTATIFFTLLMYIFDDYVGRVGRIIFNTACISLIFLVAFSRVYLGVHWVSDVLGGIVIGLLVTYGGIYTSKHLAKKV